jgi:hypothetical protein
VSSVFWWAVPFAMGVSALAFAYFTERTPSRLSAAHRATRPLIFWSEVLAWALITLVAAALMARAWFGWPP